jgi:hypothetical protein
MVWPSRKARISRIWSNWKLDPLLKDSLKFPKHDFANNQFQFGENESNDISTEIASGKIADQHIGIEKDHHETALKISSSVRKPRAAANSIALCRSWSNIINESWWRSASRTTSPRFRLDWRQDFSSIRARS